MEKNKKHPICYAASKLELEMLELVKSYHKRTTNSDAIRFLISQESEKILTKFSPIEVKSEGINL